MHDVKRLWLNADPDLKIRFQEMIFPEGLTFDTSTLTFGTETISPLYRYAPNKKDLSAKEKSLLVTLSRPVYKQLIGEIIRWNQLMSLN